MLRLSKRAWNNILIFSMLVLILILNLDQFSSNDKAQARLVVAQGEYILSMQINQLEIEKAGSQWRINPNAIAPSNMPTAQQLQSIILAWQQAYVQPADIEFDSQQFASPDTLVSLNLAGSNTPIVVAFFIVNEQVYLVLNKQVYVLMSPNIEQLLSPIVTVKKAS